MLCLSRVERPKVRGASTKSKTPTAMTFLRDTGNDAAVTAAVQRLAAPKLGSS
jgi:hypothetical protein